MSFKLETNSQKLSAYLSSCTSGQYILDNDEQRNFTKSHKWKSNLVFFIMWTGEVPGKIYFNPNVSPNGVTRYVSLDGKGRTSAIDEFIKGHFKLGNSFEVPGFERMYNKGFSELSGADRSWFLGAKVTVVEANRTLTEIEYTKFFNLIKTPSDCKTGEGLHSDLSSLNRKMLDKKLVDCPEFRDFVKKLWGNDQRFTYYTIVCNCLMYKVYGSKKRMTSEERAKFWHEGVTQAVFDAVIENMLKTWRLKNTGMNIQRFSAETVFCLFYMLYNEAIPERDILKIRDNWDEVKQFQDIVSSIAVRQDNASYKRFQMLLELV